MNRSLTEPKKLLSGGPQGSLLPLPSMGQMAGSCEAVSSMSRVNPKQVDSGACPSYVPSISSPWPLPLYNFLHSGPRAEPRPEAGTPELPAEHQEVHPEKIRVKHLMKLKIKHLSAEHAALTLQQQLFHQAPVSSFGNRRPEASSI